jgi:hypothetical protein
MLDNCDSLRKRVWELETALEDIADDAEKHECSDELILKAIALTARKVLSNN